MGNNLKIKKLKRLKAYLLFLIFNFLILIFFSCSPKVSHNILGFFFDGVPPLASQQAVSGNQETGTKKDTAAIKAKEKASIPKGTFHPPYANNKCSVCHNQDQMGKILEPQPGLCYKCHDDFEAR